MKGELTEIIDYGMSGVFSALVADDEVGLTGKIVRDLAFSLVTPIGTDDRGNTHILFSFRCLRYPCIIAYIL